jgi:hypothetical protein
MSRLPKGAERSSCQANASGCGDLDVFQFASDNLEMAEWSGGTSNAVPMSKQTLTQIYTCAITNWNQVPGDSNSGTIIPVIPQSGSGTRNFFESDLGLSDTTVTNDTYSASNTSGCIQVSEEHDPTGITHAHQPGSSTLDPKDAIEPFSVGRALLAASGYFGNSQEAPGDFAITPINGCTNVSSSWTSAGYQSDQGYCGTTPPAGATYNTVNGGTPLLAADNNPVYNSTRGLFFVVRDVDLNSNSVFQPGGTKNFVNTLFNGTTSFIAKSSNQGLIKAAFLVPDYSALGHLTAG